MSTDGQFDYSGYSLTELRRELSRIDRENRPVDFQNLAAAIVSKQESESPVGTHESGKEKWKIPVGRHGLIEIPLPEKYVLPFRVVLLLLAILPAMDLYNAITTGVNQSLRVTWVQGENLGFYVELVKDLVIFLFFVWLGTGGVRKKDDEQSSNQ